MANKILGLILWMISATSGIHIFEKNIVNITSASKPGFDYCNAIDTNDATVVPARVAVRHFKTEIFVVQARCTIFRRVSGFISLLLVIALAAADIL